ncbi:hypothetical protein P4B35_17745 [Pontiellaceae bacterium B12227]|nr:hypothetical protein [Pontiellaceae bacterium B12227]
MPASKVIISAVLAFTAIQLQAQVGSVALFYDGSYVETSASTGAEAYNMKLSLEARGFSVNTFTGITSNDFATAVTDVNTLIVPELELGNLAAVLSADTIGVISNFVAEGNSLILCAQHNPLAVNDEQFINTVFGHGVIGGVSLTTLSAALNTNVTGGTVFDGAPESLAASDGHVPWLRSSLPAGSISLYEVTSGTNVYSSVALVPEGSGQLILLAYDWWNAAPNGTQDGGWNGMLERSVQLAGLNGDLYVNQGNASPVFPYTSCATAATNIQDAVDAAGDGASVWVTNGVYLLTSEIVISKEVHLQSVNGALETTLDGGGVTRCLRLEASGSVVTGFKVTNGFTSGVWPGPQGLGGGIFCAGNGPQVVSCMVVSNQASYAGGIMAGTVRDSLVEGNTVNGTGGGLHGSVAYNTFIHNNASVRGGASEGGVYHQCVFLSNSANQGGALSFGTANNCLFVDNLAGGIAGAMLRGTANNCTMIGNAAGTQGGATWETTVRNSILWDNSAPTGPNFYLSPLVSSASPEVVHGVDGNITNAPAFVDAAGGDYRLLYANACVNAGSNAWAVGTQDLGGNDRIARGLVDMGAYENDYVENWSVLDAALNGAAAGDHAGSAVSVSADGWRVAVGAPDAEGGAGRVRVYAYEAGIWTQRGDDLIGETAGDLSGTSVSISADGARVAIGAPYNDGFESDAGNVRIFEYNGAGWSQLGNSIFGEDGYDYCGRSVSLSGDGARIAIGAHGNDQYRDYAGHARIFEYADGNWVQLGDDLDDVVYFDQSGWSVSLNGDGSRVAVSSRRDLLNDVSGEGRVRIYEYTTNVWSQLGADIDGEAAGDHMGDAVSLSADGSRVAIGASLNDGNGAESGHVRVFEYSTGTWFQVGADIDGEGTNDLSGTFVSLSGDGRRVAVGAPQNSGNGPDSGQVRVFELLRGEWRQVGLDIDGVATNELSGSAVALNANGYVAAIGAPFNSEAGAEAGQSRVLTSGMFLTMEVVGNGTVVEASGYYAYQSTLSLLATADGGWLFIDWNGDLVGDYTTAATNIIMETDKTVVARFSDDADEDGLTNTEEGTAGTLPRKADTDEDGLLDGAEVKIYGSSPLLKNSDGDAYEDGYEVSVGLSPAVNNTAFLADFVHSNATSYGYYGTNALLDLGIGDIGVEITNGMAELSVQLWQSDDLVTWTNMGSDVSWQEPVDSEKKFFRVRAEP